MARSLSVGLICVVGLAASVPGCQRDDSADRAIKTAARSVQSSTMTVDRAERQTKLSAGLDQASKAPAGSKAHESAAALISSTAMQGKSIVPSGSAGLIERGPMFDGRGADIEAYKLVESGVSNRLALVRSSLNEYLDQHAVAAAAAKFNPAEAVAGMDAAIANVEKSIADRKAAQADLNKQIADKQSLVTQQLNSAKKADDEAGALRQQALSMKATDAVAVIEQATVAKRKADKFRLDAADIQHGIDALKAQLPELNLLVDQFNSQKKSLEASKADLLAKQASNSATVTTSRAAADKAAASIERQMGEIRTLRADRFTKTTDEAIANLKSSLASAQKANTDSPGQAKLAVGTIQQSIGDVHWSRAIEASMYLGTLDALSKAEPALANKDAFASEAQNVAKQEKEALDAAKAAYEASRDAFKSVPVKGPGASDIKERLQKLSDRIGLIAGVVGGESLDSLGDMTIRSRVTPPAPKASDAPAPTNTPAPSSAPAAAADIAVPADLLAAMDTWLKASKDGDTAALMGMLKANNDAEKKAIEGIFNMQGTMIKLDATCQKKFNAKFSEALAKSPMAQAATGLDSSKYNNLTAKDLNIKMATPDMGSFSLPGVPMPLSAVKDGGDWKISFGAMGAMLTQGPAAQMMGAMGTVMNDLLKGVEDGSIPDMQTLAAQFQQKMIGAMGMGGGNRGPGRGRAPEDPTK
ncbi:MAG: hypothetical protein KGS45_02425 [Planctomycetes bacterium]|nr:hypothetical protein [Planctomycetota bacterium]